MHSNSMLSPLSQSLQLIKAQTPLRKITANDKFPCFGCFDKTGKRFNCKICNGRGFISGDHPMVQFAQDFIERKVSRSNSSVSKSLIENSSIKIRKSMGKIPSTIQESEEQDQQNQAKHEGINCDNCGADPITGTRYQCTQCDDYDLCKSCFHKDVHPQDHKMKVIQNSHSVRASCRPSKQYLDKLRESQMSRSKFIPRK